MRYDCYEFEIHPPIRVEIEIHPPIRVEFEIHPPIRVEFKIHPPIRMETGPSGQLGNISLKFKSLKKSEKVWKMFWDVYVLVEFCLLCATI